MSNFVISTALIVNLKKEVLSMDLHVKSGRFSLPMGKSDEGESPIKALSREMREELGIEVGDTLYLGEDTLPDGNLNHTFLVTSWEGEIENREPEKAIGLKFRPMSEIIGCMPKWGYATTAAITRYLDHLKQEAKVKKLEVEQCPACGRNMHKGQTYCQECHEELIEEAGLRAEEERLQVEEAWYGSPEWAELQSEGFNRKEEPDKE